MEVRLTSKSGTDVVFDAPATDESAFYEEVGKQLIKCPYPDTINLECELGTVSYSLTERSATLCIFEQRNTITDLKPGVFPHKKLSFADWATAERRKSSFGQLNDGQLGQGSYKFYELEPEENGEVKAIWGSVGMIGKKTQSTTYNVSQAWIKYYEKLQKGYFDLTDVYLDTAEELGVDEEDEAPAEKTVNIYAVALYKVLSQQVAQAIELQLVDATVTRGMVKMAQEILDDVCHMTVKTDADLEEFNNKLLKLMLVCPRKVINMKDWKARNTSKEEIKRVLDREQDLVDAMQGKITIQKHDVKDISEDATEPFTDMGVTISPADDKARNMILKKLPDHLKSKVANIYRVDNKRHRKRFLKYLKDNKLDLEKDVMTLWHGSRNENWLSIIEKGLMIHPNAIITGKMFGYGIYFAPSAEKSWGYTSHTGAYWTKGSQDLAFMGLYQCAYGTPYYPNGSWGNQYDKKFMKEHGCNCLHARRHDCGLRNDEIVFYDEGAMYLSYIVEFH